MSANSVVKSVFKKSGTSISASVSGDKLVHEAGGIEADISAVAKGDILAGSGTGAIGIIAASGKSDGDVLTLQADGTVDYEAAAGGGGGISHDGSTADGVLTYKDADEATVEANLTYDGTDLSMFKDSENTEFIISAYHDTEATTPQITLRKGDNTQASPALVDDDAVLGTISFQGYDGDSWAQGAKIEARAEGTPASDDMASELTFWTTPDSSQTAAQRMTIGQDGNVGIGTAAPAGNLHIYNASSGATANASINQLVIENDDSVGISILSPNTSAGYIAFADPQDDIAGGILYDHDANDFKILGKGDTSVMMTIDSAGNVGIGTDNPSTTLDINSASHNVTQFALSVDGGQLLEMGTEGSSSYSWIKAAHSSYSLSLGGGDSVGHLVINTSGVISGDFNDTSDVALKENIQTISSGLSIVNTLNPITFDWKDESKGSNSGFIAQEVEEVLPNDVSGEDFDISVEDSSIGKSINVTGIVAHLTKAVQELSAKVEALENA